MIFEQNKPFIKKVYHFIKIIGHIHPFYPFLIFMLLNSLKITLFNYFLIPIQTMATFNYKLQMTLLLAIIVYPLIFKLKSSLPFIMIYTIQILYIVANMSYYLFYHNYVHIMQWITLFQEAFLSAGHSAAPMNLKMFIIFIDIPAFAYILFNYSKVREFIMSIRIQQLILAFSAIIIISFVEFNNYSQGFSVLQYVKDQSRGESPIVERYGTVANNMVTLYLNRGERGHEKKLIYGNSISSGSISSASPNFVVIQVESMDANIVKQTYKEQYIMPYLHDMAEKNIYYPYVMSYHMGGGTSDSEFSIINSVHPLEDYPAIKLTNYNYPNSFVKILSNAHYETLAFHGNVGNFYNRDIAFPKMGFTNFYDILRMKFEDTGWGAPDASVFDFTLEKLQKVKKPFFCYNITMTSHSPFTNAVNYYNNPLYADIEDENVKNYFNSLSYVDQSIHDFVEKIQHRYKNTYIFILGDHTPNITTELYAQASYSLDNRYFEFVPLIILTPNGKSYKEESKVASFVDLAPTILNAAKIKYEYKSNGQDLIYGAQKNLPILFKNKEYDRELLFKNFTQPVIIK